MVVYCFSTMTGKLEQSLQVFTIYFVKSVLSEASSNQQIAWLIEKKKKKIDTCSVIFVCPLWLPVTSSESAVTGVMGYGP